MSDITQTINPLYLLETLQSFLEQGGTLLIVLMMATWFLWLLILERYYYFYVAHKSIDKRIIAEWLPRTDKQSWYAHKIRTQLLSQAKIQINKNLHTIEIVVVIAPLLGLLGTVTGMIDVFDVMATAGSSNARGMAAGVSKATIPTMAGMVVSLTGMLFSINLQRLAKCSYESLSNHLIIEGMK